MGSYCILLIRFVLRVLQIVDPEAPDSQKEPFVRPAFMRYRLQVVTDKNEAHLFRPESFLDLKPPTSNL